MPTIAEASLSETDRRVLDRFVVALREQLGEIVFVRDSPDEHDDEVRRLIWDVAWTEDAGLFDYSVRVTDRRWLEGRREIRSFFIQEVDRDKIVPYGEP